LRKIFPSTFRLRVVHAMYTICIQMIFTWLPSGIPLVDQKE